MRITRKGHTHWRVIDGGKPDPTTPAPFFIRLRQEQTKHESVRSLTPEEVEALHGVDRERP